MEQLTLPSSPSLCVLLSLFRKGFVGTCNRSITNKLAGRRDSVYSTPSAFRNIPSFVRWFFCFLQCSTRWALNFVDTYLRRTTDGGRCRCGSRVSYLAGSRKGARQYVFKETTMITPFYYLLLRIFYKQQFWLAESCYHCCRLYTTMTKLRLFMYLKWVETC